MKMKKMKAAMAAMAIVALTFTACSGDDGETGPAGPAGNANVQSSNYTVLVADWTPGAVLRDTLSVPAITQAVVDNGMVQVYQRRTDSTSWEAMPFSYIAFLGGQPVTLTFQAGYNVGEVHLTGTNAVNANLTPGPVFPGDRDFKVVVVPSASLVDGVDVNNYEEVKMVYGIEEYDVK